MELAGAELKLKPCPFCGSKAELDSWFPVVKYIVHCLGCNCVAPDAAKTEAEAAEVWNKRAKISES